MIILKNEDLKIKDDLYYEKNIEKPFTGKICYKGQFRNDKEIGTWIESDSKGNIVSEEKYS